MSCPFTMKSCKYCTLKFCGEREEESNADTFSTTIEMPKKTMKQEPIPITPEILEKNGFEKREFINEVNCKEEYWIYCDDYYSLYVIEFNDGLYKVEHHSEELINYTDRIHISYVHELQTFLDLCGVDKRIVL